MTLCNQNKVPHLFSVSYPYPYPYKVIAKGRKKDLNQRQPRFRRCTERDGLSTKFLHGSDDTKNHNEGVITMMTRKEFRGWSREVMMIHAQKRIREGLLEEGNCRCFCCNDRPFRGHFYSVYPLSVVFGRKGESTK